MNSVDKWLNSLRRTVFEYYFKEHQLMRFMDAYAPDSIFDFLHFHAFKHTVLNKLRNGTSPYNFQMLRKHSLGLIAQSQFTILVISRLLCHCAIKRSFTQTVMSRISFCLFNNKEFLAEHALSLYRTGLLELRCNPSLFGTIQYFTLAGIYGCKPAIVQLIRLLEERRLAAKFRYGRPDYSENSKFVLNLKQLL